MCIRLYYLLTRFNVNTEVYNWYFPNVTSSIISFRINIFNFCIRCVWIIMTYIKPYFYYTTLLFGCAIGPKLYYQKWALIWSLIYVCGMIIDHEFISNFLVVVNCFIIFTDIIFINLRLLSLTYLFPIHLMFYQENHITAKYKLAQTITF